MAERVAQGMLDRAHQLLTQLGLQESPARREALTMAQAQRYGRERSMLDGMLRGGENVDNRRLTQQQWTSEAQGLGGQFGSFRQVTGTGELLAQYQRLQQQWMQQQHELGRRQSYGG